MEPSGGMTRIKAEVPMAEMLTYGQALTSMTGGRGDYHMQFLRYDEVPTHDAQKLIEFARRAFDAKVGEEMKREDGTIMHAELQIGDSRIMLGPKWCAKCGKTRRSTGGCPRARALRSSACRPVARSLKS